MSELIHGSRHGPRGSDPTLTDVWSEVTATTETAWSGATAYSAGDLVSHGNFNWMAIRDNTNVEPEVASGWFTYWTFNASLLLVGTNSAPTVDVPNPVPTRFRLSVGAPNIVDADGTIVLYTQHQNEIQADLSGVTTGDIPFYIPREYQHDYDVPYHTHDDSGVYVACRLLSTGGFLYGVP